MDAPHSIPLPPSATHSALTSQSIQLSHPTVLILLGNDLKNREWKTLAEESAVPGGTVGDPTAAQLRVHNEELLSSQLFCQCSLLMWPRAFKGKKLLQAQCYPCLPRFQIGMSTAKMQMDAFTVLPQLSAQS